MAYGSEYGSFSVVWTFEPEDENVEGGDVTLEVEYTVDRNCDYGVDRSPVWDEYTITSVKCPENPAAEAEVVRQWNMGAKFDEWLREKAQENEE